MGIAVKDYHHIALVVRDLKKCIWIASDSDLFHESISFCFAARLDRTPAFACLRAESPSSVFKTS